MRYLFLITFFLTTLVAFNVELSSPQLANGQTIVAEFSKQKGIDYKTISVDKKRFPVFTHPQKENKQYALIPMSYYQQPVSKKIIINYAENGLERSKEMFIKVQDGKYKKEEITVNSSKVNPKSKEVKERISQEYNEAMRIYTTLTPKNYLDSKFILPLDSFITSDFGKARTYNGSLKGYHSGTDFRAEVGTSIIASNRGKVVLVKDRFYSGGTVLIDHGQGIYTCYFHMSAFSVVEGNIVEKGQKIGLSGQSGRVTGPHLHFAVRINGVQVDPLQFIELMNKNIFI